MDTAHADRAAHRLAPSAVLGGLLGAYLSAVFIVLLLAVTGPAIEPFSLGVVLRAFILPLYLLVLALAAFGPALAVVLFGVGLLLVLQQR